MRETLVDPLYRNVQKIHTSTEQNAFRIDEDRILDTPGDGACFFRSIAYALSGDPRYLQCDDADAKRALQQLREQFVEVVIRCWDTEFNDLPMSTIVEVEHGVNTRERYRQFMSRPDAWAGQPEVYVAQYICGGLAVYQPKGGQIVRMQRYGTTGSESLTVFYDGRTHYCAVERR